MAHTPRLAHAMLSATAVAALVVSISYGELAPIAFPFAFAAIYLIAALVGLPLYFLARRTGIAGWPIAALAGLAISQIQPLLDRTPPGAGVLVEPAWLAVAGIAGGLIFWKTVRPPVEMP
ncbi:hypothetical protein ACCC88_05610 [Sphingomonas sp. Sphisp140]|uniref:hypothetical protein n=1 Tax=unclassified Sphingomonas TaxID=196159 RepID=UPI0039B0962E